MLKKKIKVLSVVCARAGSKGLKNKCIAKIKNRMNVEYAIEFSLALGENVKTVVSTDIDELVGYCKEAGVCCIRRSPNLCTDDCKIDDALADAIKQYGEDIEYCSLVYGNIPTRYVSLFHETLGFLEANKDYDAAISMQNVEKYNPEWMFDLAYNELPPKKAHHYRRQMLPQKMIHDGHTLIFRSNGFYKRYKNEDAYDKSLYTVFGRKIKPILNDLLIIDIDTKKDIKLAEALFNLEHQ